MIGTQSFLLRALYVLPTALLTYSVVNPPIAVSAN